MKDFLDRLVFLAVVLLFFPGVFDDRCDIVAQKMERETGKGNKGVCRIYGEAKDSNGALAPESLVFFKSCGFETSVKTDSAGKYSVMLPRGIYEVGAQLRPGLQIYPRSPLDVSCEKELLVNVYSFPDSLLDDDGRSVFKFSSFAYPAKNRKGNNVMIAYLRESALGTTEIYWNATLTIDIYTVSASRIVRDLNAPTIRAEGNVWLEDGRTQQKVKTIMFSFKQGTLEIHRTFE